jgi:glycosyltransferase involved in cell wall biosynthesis
MSAARPLFTVFTPTFNRADTLHRVYDSLTAQTSSDFEWLIVDDGSTDETGELVKGWRAEAEFPIRYFQQPNAGKHVAFNRGVREAAGELFLTFDSDDACVPEALERFRFHWDSIPADVRPGFSAVTANCCDQHGQLIGTPFPSDPLDAFPMEMRLKYGVKGEKWGFQRTDVLREFPFPEVAGQPFVSEDVVWNRIGKRYRTRFVNEILRIYHVGSADSLTKQAKLAGERAPMLVMSTQEILNEDFEWFRDSPLTFLKYATNYVRYSFHCGRGPLAQSRRLQPRARALHVVALPLGGFFYVRDRMRVRRS